MRLFRLWVSSLLVPGLTWAHPTEVKSASARPKSKFFVEFEPSFDGSVHKRFVDSHDDLMVHHQVDHELLQGMSFSVEDFGEVTLEKLSQMPGVKRAWRSQNIERRDFIMPQNVLGIWNDHIRSGVQKLHDRNITGSGIVIGMLDTGVDANHPALQGKILPGYNFCSNQTTGFNNTDTDGHGTFCASVAVGSSHDFMGVAPGAKLRMYTVPDSCPQMDARYDSEVLFLQAMLKMYDDKVDLISISVGNEYPFQNSYAALAVERVAQKIPVVLAAANSGALGAYSGMDGASAQHAISVAFMNLPSSFRGLPIW